MCGTRTGKTNVIRIGLWQIQLKIDRRSRECLYFSIYYVCKSHRAFISSTKRKKKEIIRAWNQKFTFEKVTDGRTQSFFCFFSSFFSVCTVQKYTINLNHSLVRNWNTFTIQPTINRIIHLNISFSWDSLHSSSSIVSYLNTFFFRALVRVGPLYLNNTNSHLIYMK